MAKSLRASGKKSNRSKLRARVFGPVESARTERLSAKLLEIASRPKPAKSEMEVDKEEAGKEASSVPQPNEAEAMDIDDAPEARPSRPSSSSKRTGGRIHKKRQKKASSSILFPTYANKKSLLSGKRRKR